MDSFLEKITLYDFFSYFIPGALCLTLTVYGLWPEAKQFLMDTNNHFYGYFVFSLIIFSYVFGIALSSIANVLYVKIPKLCLDKMNLQHNQKFTVDEDALKNALLASGTSQRCIDDALSKDPSSKKQGLSLVNHFRTKIYADIQADSRYKRIHNYSSSASMYKNISCAFFVGGILPLILHLFLQIQILKGFPVFLAFEIGLMIAFLFRWKRFERKKYLYTINWFIQKYT